MENISGYARILARTRVEQQLNKPIIGKPYLKYGQCYALWSYFFQLGGILGAKHSANLDEFGLAFLGARGDSGAVERLFTKIANSLVESSLTDSMKFEDYVGAEFVKRVGYTGDPMSFFFEHGMEKINQETAEELAWQYALDGAALGAIYPDVLREMFQRTHEGVSEENWEQARAAGLKIPTEQDLMSYEEVEEGEDEVFMAYCRECCPKLFSILIA